MWKCFEILRPVARIVRRPSVARVATKPARIAATVGATAVRRSPRAALGAIAAKPIGGAVGPVLACFLVGGALMLPTERGEILTAPPEGSYAEVGEPSFSDLLAGGASPFAGIFGAPEDLRAYGAAAFPGTSILGGFSGSSTIAGLQAGQEGGGGFSVAGGGGGSSVAPGGPVPVPAPPGLAVIAAAVAGWWAMLRRRRKPEPVFVWSEEHYSFGRWRRTDPQAHGNGRDGEA